MGDNRTQTILVVDDDDLQTASIASALEREGFKAVRVHSGMEAVRYFESGSADLVVLDVAMPGMDGYEVCKRIRSSEKTKAVPVVFLSAKASAKDYLAGTKSGGDTYLTKPFRASQLLTIVRMMLAVRRK